MIAEVMDLRSMMNVGGGYREVILQHFSTMKIRMRTCPLKDLT